MEYNAFNKSLQKHYALGVGFSHVGSAENAVERVQDLIQEQNITTIDFIATIVSLREEIFNKQLTKAFAAQSLFFTAAELEEQTPRLLNPSPYIYSLKRCHGVCEAAALAAAGIKGRLIIGKTNRTPYTFALAMWEE